MQNLFVIEAVPAWFDNRQKRLIKAPKHYMFDAGLAAVVEIKAASAVDRSDACHLEWLRGELGERFVHGLVLHAGPRGYELAPRITAVPIGVLWS